MREIVLDTETTGLDPKTGHRIVEIGCVELVNHLPTDHNFHEYINPKRDMPIEAFNVHGLSEEYLADFSEFSAIAEAFVAYVGDAKLIIHNAEFDMGFINAELKALGMDPLPFEQALDTVPMARQRFPGSRVNLDALCSRFGIDNSDRELHGALKDAHLLAAVYLELIGGRQPEMILKDDKKKNVEVKASDKTFREPRPHAPLDEELAAHKTFVSNIKENLWGVESE